MKRQFTYPLYGLEELDVERVPGELSLEPDEGVARGHGLDQRRVQGQLRGVGDHLRELGVPGLADARQVQVALCQGTRLKKGT